MFNKKGLFENGVNPIAVLVGIIAAIWAFYTSGTMGSGLLMQFIVTIVVGVVGFFIFNFIITKD